MLLITILALGFLIFVHELGHFLVAKYFNVEVLEFAIGFGPTVLSFTWGETLYALRAIPLGGFVRMAGDNPHDVEELEEAGGDSSRWFLSQSYWPKFSIVFAGPLFNLLFAIILASGSLFWFGQPEILEDSIIGDVMEKHPASNAGMIRGDRVVAVDGKSITLWDDLSLIVRNSEGNPLEFEIERPLEGGSEGEFEKVTLTITPTNEPSELDAIAGTTAEPRYRIGIFPATTRKEIGFTKSVELGVRQIVFITELTIRGLSGMVMGNVSTKNIAGPIYIFKQGTDAARSGVDRLIDFMVFLSVSLALLNLLPIPILDGGHLLFFTLEALKGSPVNMRIQEKAAQVGMAFLLLLMVLALSNDVRRLLE